ncbi:hypothetical protein [Kitasatospora sp. NBC_00315]|uniref:hypothetical protein n=1 Tax=Kitasatospora sp. NBC_00315 TaxID=2975963 RepID=UPI00324814B9
MEALTSADQRLLVEKNNSSISNVMAVVTIVPALCRISTPSLGPAGARTGATSSRASAPIRPAGSPVTAIRPDVAGASGSIGAPAAVSSSAGSAACGAPATTPVRAPHRRTGPTSGSTSSTRHSGMPLPRARAGRCATALRPPWT